MSKFGSFLGNVLRLVGYVYFPYFTAAFDAVRNSRMARAERRRARQAYNDALTDRLQQMSAQPASARLAALFSRMPSRMAMVRKSRKSRKSMKTAKKAGSKLGPMAMYVKEHRAEIQADSKKSGRKFLQVAAEHYRMHKH